MPLTLLTSTYLLIHQMMSKTPHLIAANSRRYEEDIYWRRIEEEQMYWGEQRHRMAPPPLMSRPGMPVPPLLVSVNTDVH